MLVLPNFGHIITSTIYFESRDFFGDVMDRIYDVTTFISKKFILRRPGVAIFAGIIKIVTMFIKTIFKNSRKVKTRNYVSNCNLYLYFLI